MAVIIHDFFSCYRHPKNPSAGQARSQASTCRRARGLLHKRHVSHLALRRYLLRHDDQSPRRAQRFSLIHCVPPIQRLPGALGVVLQAYIGRTYLEKKKNTSTFWESFLLAREGRRNMPQTVSCISLLGWMEEGDAVDYLTEGCVSKAPMTRDEAGRIWREMRDKTHAAARARGYAIPSWRASNGEAASQFLSKVGEPVKSVIEIDPARLIAFQFYVAKERSAFHMGKPDNWAQRCLPTERLRASLQIASDGNCIFFDVPHAEHVLTLTKEANSGWSKATPTSWSATLGMAVIFCGRATTAPTPI